MIQRFQRVWLIQNICQAHPSAAGQEHYYVGREWGKAPIWHENPIVAMRFATWNEATHIIHHADLVGIAVEHTFVQREL